jgi:hypothetical protein
LPAGLNEAFGLILVWFCCVKMAISSLEFPHGPTKVRTAPDGPPLYAGENEDYDLDFFQETASDNDWLRYNRWITEQAETC